MKKEMKDKENEDARRKLRELKERYGLTWLQIAKVFGRTQRTIEDWAGGQRNIPIPCRILIDTFLENPQVFKKHKLKLYK